MNKRFVLLTIIFLIGFAFFAFNNNFLTVKADELSDNIEEQLQNIDLDELKEYFEQIKNKPIDADLTQYIYSMLNGEYNLDFSSVFEYIINITFNKLFEILPIFISILAISIFCGITQSLKSSFMTDEIADIIFFVSFLSVILLLSSEVVSILQNAKNVIENISKLSQIVSPIMITLMMSLGGSVSAKIFQPAVGFLINGVINIVLLIILPLVSIIILFNVVSSISNSNSLKKFSDSATSIIKFIMGLTITVFGVFLSIQGIASGNFDKISIKVAKYTISNSIPLIGGFIKDGFDIVLAGSLLIKNTVGVVSIFALFYTILSPILYIFVFSLLLKIVSALIEPISDSRISNFCFYISKCISYINMAIIMVSFMLFIMTFLMIISVNNIF